MTVTGEADPLRRAAERLADHLAADGYAFLEDDAVALLAAQLGLFLVLARIPAQAEKRGGLHRPG